jgi:glucosylglycerate synthase
MFGRSEAVKKSSKLAYEENPEKVERAEVVVGISSCDSAAFIGHTAEQAAKGLVDYFGSKNSVLVNVDSDSGDRTKEVFLGTTTRVPKVYLCTPPATKGRGHKLISLVSKAAELKAEAVIVVDAASKSITPLWIKNLGEPIFSGFSFVTPLYLRHKYEGILTSGIVYPLTRVLYGRRVRQPNGGDLAFGMTMAETYLRHPTAGEKAVQQAGVDVWMTTLAINQGVPICQSYVGRPKMQRSPDGVMPQLSAFVDVVGTVFELMGSFQDRWKKVRWSKPTAVFGFGMGEPDAPPPLEVSEADLYRVFLQGFSQYQALWESLLDNKTFSKLTEIKNLPVAHFSFPSELWARIVFRYTVAYRNQVTDRQTLLESLLPIFHGKSLCFVKKTERMSVQQAEEYIENECMIFEEMKSYLVADWQGNQ